MANDELRALHAAAWEAILRDEELRAFRQKCSIHEIRQVIRASITAALAEKDGDEPIEHEKIPPLAPTMRCPECWTYGHQHKKMCKYSGAGMANHIKIPLPERKV